MKILHQKKAFTLVEVLVGIIIVAILVILVSPLLSFGIRPGSLSRAQMAGILSNARQIHLAAFAISIESEPRERPIWPSASDTNSSLSAFFNQLELAGTDIQRLLGAPGITTKVTGEPGSLTIKCDPNPPFRFYAVGDRPPSDGKQVFLSTFNIRCAPGSITIDEDARPFGDNGGVIFRRDGSGEAWQKRLLMSRAAQDSIPQDQAPDLDWR